ncbi:MAG: CHASE domain-containing protein [Thiobacillus sp.]|nr:CHASE domain-containing protein [Thiobacillus sp.]
MLAAASESFAYVPLGRARFRFIFENALVPWFVLGLTVALTLWLWRSAETSVATRQNEQFLQAAESQKNILLGRMQDYEQVLRGGVALFEATGGMPSREQWRRYVDSLELDRTLPGIGGTGFSVMLTRDQKDSHEASVRAEGFPDFQVYPDNKHDTLSSIVYLEPFAGRNLRAFGYNMYSDPVRREAMERARDTGRPALSGKVTLVQETSPEVQPGFLMYLPVYRTGEPHETPAARREALLGFVYSPFRAGDLLSTVLALGDQGVDLRLFDGPARPENLLFASRQAARSPRHTTDIPFTVAGRVWTARFSSSAAYEEKTSTSQPKMILMGGLLLDILLFAVLYINARSNRKIRDTTRQLEQSLDSYKTLVRNIPGAVFRRQADPSLSLVQVSDGIEALTAEPPDRFLSGALSFNSLISPEDISKVKRVITEALAKQVHYEVEYRIEATNEFKRWVSERGRGMSDETGRLQWVDGVILDITDRKAAEAIIRDLAFKDTLTRLPNRRLLLDRLHHQIASSERTKQHGAVLFIDIDDFKTINDTLGHEAGDKMLMEVARRLRKTVRESDTVARLGGDEFVVILDNLGHLAHEARAGAADLAGKLRSELSAPYPLEAKAYTVTPSIGIALFCGHTVSAHQLLRRADQAMYKAKAAGRNQLMFYDEDNPKVSNA